MDEHRLGYANNPSDDIDWCTARGHRAYVVGACPGVYQPPGLLITRGAQVVGVAAVGDTLVYDGALIEIRTPG